MAFVRAATKKDVPPGTAIQFEHGGEQVAICNVGGSIYAVDNVCPHQGGPLAMGALHGSTLVCPFHGWEFDCITGECERNPRLLIRKFEVREEGEDILVNIR